MKKRYWMPFVFFVAVIRLSNSQADNSWFWTASTDESGWEFRLSDPGDAEQIQVATDENTKQLAVILPADMSVEVGMRVQVLDISGVVLKNERIEQHEQVVDISDLPLGVYTLRIQSPKALTERSFNVTRSHNL